MIAVPATADLLKMTLTVPPWAIGPIRRTVVNRLSGPGRGGLAHTVGRVANGWGTPSVQGCAEGCPTDAPAIGRATVHTVPIRPAPNGAGAVR